MSNPAQSYDRVAKSEAARGLQVQNRAAYRAFNNFAKAAIIRHALQQFDGVPTGIAFLDLASGRGGDLAKILVVGRGTPVLRYTALDVSPASIEEARRRCTELYKGGKVQCSGANMAIDVFDVFSPDAWSASPLTQQPASYHIASMQFALHYGCSELERLRRFLAAVSNSLVDGGVFCGTTSDGPVLRKYLARELDRFKQQAASKKKEQNADDVEGVSDSNATPSQTSAAPFRISFPDSTTEETVSQLQRLFDGNSGEDVPALGIAYRFQLDDTVSGNDLVDDIEYSIPRYLLLEEAKRAGLQPVPEMCKNLYEGFRAGYVPSGDIRPPLTESDILLSSFYFCFCFRRVARNNTIEASDSAKKE